MDNLKERNHNEGLVNHMLKVFIADDSVVVREKLKEAIEEMGSFKVVGESGNAEQAILEIRRLNPEVVILDIRMPGGGGLPVLKDIKAREPVRTAIVLTSFPFPQYRETYLAAGTDYFFDKTRDIQKLLDVLKELEHQSHVPTCAKNGAQP
jgi:DNA-binding NarL/FixJ family response regulator